MQIVPLQSLPNQIVNIALDGQACTLHVYQKFYGVFMNIYVDDVLIIGGVVCEDRNRIVRSEYLGFKGDFAFFDTVGTRDPEFDTIGTQYLLAYFSEGELPSPLGIT